MKTFYDVVIVGSGFGGSVLAYRLADAQKKNRGKVSVCVLERGRRYNRGEFPRDLARSKDWWWRREGRRGWTGLLDFRLFNHMMVLSGSGVGGTSLIYLDVQIQAFESTFKTPGRWPQELNSKEVLEPYYKRMAQIMKPSPIPQPALKTRALEAAAIGAGFPERFKLLDLAVYWGRNGPEPGVLAPDPYERGGPPQIGCAHCGECFIGCNTHAKNTVDLNYLWFAEQLGAEVYSQHKVTKIERNPNDGGYSVSYDDLRWNFPGQVSAKVLVIAAGCLGSTELLLRSKHGYKRGKQSVPPTLPELSPKLGEYFSGNGDFGGVGFETNRTVNLMHGPTITAMVDFRDRQNNRGFIVEDGGLPDFLRANLRYLPGGFAYWRSLLRFLRKMLRRGGRSDLVEGIFRILDYEDVRDALPYLVMGLDAADGKMSIDSEGKLQIDWDNTRSLQYYREIEVALRQLTESPAPGLDGNFMPIPTWSAQKRMLTVHPLGGCPMGENWNSGVVSSDGKVFNYPNLYVVDGSIVPSAIGPNPSHTIGAIAERAAERMIAAGAY